MSRTGRLSGKEIYKYTNTDTIYKQVVNNLTSATAAHIRKQGGTRIVYVYSPAGGSGKTTVAAGISSVLAKSNQRTLFLSMDELQAFGWMMTEPRTMPAEVEKQLMFQSSFVYNLIKPHLVKQDFYMMPPFTRMLSSLNIREDSFVRLLENYRCRQGIRLYRGGRGSRVFGDGIPYHEYVPTHTHHRSTGRGVQIQDVLSSQ